MDKLLFSHFRITNVKLINLKKNPSREPLEIDTTA